MKRKLMYVIMAIAAITTLNSCSDDDFKKAYDEKTYVDVPYLFSEDYKDSIQVPYDLSKPLTDWMDMLKDGTKVCKLSIPGTHDTMTGMGFYQPLLKYVFNPKQILPDILLDMFDNIGMVPKWYLEEHREFTGWWI